MDTSRDQSDEVLLALARELLDDSDKTVQLLEALLNPDFDAESFALEQLLDEV
jgi:hypothetical protein